MFRQILTALGLVAIGGCSPNKNAEGQFTLESGVKVTSLSSCLQSNQSIAPSIEKMQSFYRVRVVASAVCDIELEPPFLTLSNHQMVTLALRPKRHRALGFQHDCECARSMTIDISGRLEVGQTLYLLNDYEVVGHLQVP